MTAARLTREDVLRIATLAHLDLTDAEVDRFTTELGAILTYASDIQTVDTSGVVPMSHANAGDGRTSHANAGDEDAPATPTTIIGRDDVAEPSLDRTVALSNAPDAANGLFRVPKVRG
jgi:aspartyl-tRNA(Asn)/glutamyl-tRNA(Gln) amidotransferase subunit C